MYPVLLEGLTPSSNVSPALRTARPLVQIAGGFCRFSPGFGTLCLAQNLCFKFGLVLVVIRQRRINLRQRQMRLLQEHLFRAGAMR